MNTTVESAASLAAEVAAGAGGVGDVELIVCPPFVSLAAVRDAVAGSRVRVGAQNMHQEGSGAFT